MALSLTSPGIFSANSGVLPAYKDVLPYNTYVQWYENVHIPDWMGAKTGAITSAWRYQSLDPDSELPFLVTYRYPDISANSAPEFMNVTLNHPSLPEGGPINKFIKINVMSGPHVQTWRSGSTGDTRGPLLVTESIEPTGMTPDQFDEWYRDVYIYEVSLMEGWRRTSRFSNGMGSPKWFALHEFEESAVFEANTTGKISGLLGKSDETKEVEKAAKMVEIALWKLVRVYGDGAAAWGRPGEDHIL
ncbi:hypothetical protein B0H66DRAFT_631100 [Apodospora peruviana]|uniref:Uncharacterized protein n=1 Tax=Apodospora peruviana TaxID=516989 RepID=A0AAE0HWU7_9PEZI|nr:hypothetical protein B0H66DRAFT_631100 [Apodospora peruviana]